MNYRNKRADIEDLCGINPHWQLEMGAFSAMKSSIIAILLTIGKMDIGRYPDVKVLEQSVLGIGTILSNFHSLGTTPLHRELLISLVRVETILYELLLSAYVLTHHRHLWP